MSDYVSETEALADIYDDCSSWNDDFAPYSTSEKRAYCKAKSQCFPKSAIGKFVVIQTPRRNTKVVTTLYLVDRAKTKRYWWSHASWWAMVFEKRSAAETQTRKYKYNNIRVKEITPAMCNMDYFEEEYENNY